MLVLPSTIRLQQSNHNLNLNSARIEANFIDIFNRNFSKLDYFIILKCNERANLQNSELSLLDGYDDDCYLPIKPNLTYTLITHSENTNI
jgi:hypothetical protein